VESLPLLDPPKPYALEAARADLRAWGALQGDTALSEHGASLFELPIEPQHARLLVQARREECLDEMIDLVSVLSVGRPLFLPGTRDLGIDDDLRLSGCDATAAIRALRAPRPADHDVSDFVVREARATRARLRRVLGLPESDPCAPASIKRDAIVRAAIAADPRLAHVVRVRGRGVFFSNGGTELELARESALVHVRDPEAILALDTRAFGTGRQARVLLTCAMAIPLSVLARAGLGSDRIAGVKLAGKRVLARIERVYAERVLSEREEVPEGELARSALVELLTRGSLFRDAVATTRDRLTHLAVAAWLASRGHPAGVPAREPIPALEAWLTARVASLGVESGDDLALLSASDFLAPELPYEARGTVESEYPVHVSAGDTSYRAQYDLERGQVTLHRVKGSSSALPSLGYLPKFPGLRICVEGPAGVTVVRARG
jgi:HrpA-like RNA helicase